MDGITSSNSTQIADFIVIGAGIAGASIGYELAAHGRVLVLEQEEHPGYHTTGRSAAYYIESYGNSVVRALTSASRAFFENREGNPLFAGPLLTPRGALVVGTEMDSAHIKALFAAVRGQGIEASMLDTASINAVVPVLRPEFAASGFIEPGATEIDVAQLHQGYLQGLTKRGGTLVRSAPVTGLSGPGLWTVTTPTQSWSAPVVVNAAGAWADAIAALAGLTPIGLQPMRRTAVLFNDATPRNAAEWPLVVAADESFYFKPESGHILGSPADETPSPPCDAQPDELDVAITIDRIERATTMQVSRVMRKWAGLRTFTPDRTPVVGEDPRAPGFVWFAGQGGFGIQLAPALARLGSALALGLGCPTDIAERGVNLSNLTVHRLLETDHVRPRLHSLGAGT